MFQTGLEKYLISAAFAETREVPLGFLISVNLSACINSSPTGPVFMKFDIGFFHLESVEKV